jgi:hypothetical protein
MPAHVHEISPLLFPNERLHDDNGWKGRHLRACGTSPIAMMVTALHHYVLRHENRFETAIAHDYVLGPAVKESLQSLRTLLNGEIGNLDGGTTDSAICKVLQCGGWNPDTGEVRAEQEVTCG